MPNDYKKGKIYVLREFDNDKVFYVGSTCQSLANRMSEHKRAINKTKSNHYAVYEYIRKIGEDNFYIELYELFPCETNYELLKREGKVIRKFKKKYPDFITNHVIPGRTDKEYREDTKEHIREQNAQYRHNNKESIKEYQRLTYKKNRDQRLEYCKIRVTCECGTVQTKAHLNRHRESMKHKTLMDGYESA